MDNALLSPGEASGVRKSKAVFYVGSRHSRNSSVNSIGEDEAEAELLPGLKGSQSNLSKEAEGFGEGSESCGGRCEVSGSCMCKLSVVFYLAACILISALYVAFYGKNQAIFGDAWIPGKPTVHDKPPPVPPRYFQDLPYTEWISQRWVYHNATFSADWPRLPEEVDQIRQTVAGKVGGERGLWLLTKSQLFFARDIYTAVPQRASFENISKQLDLEVPPDSYIISHLDSNLYLVSELNMTYLDCSLEECDIAGSTCDLLPFDSVLSHCYSLSTGMLWLGTPQGLFTVSHDEDGCLVFSNTSEVLGPVLTLAWRSAVTNGVSSFRHSQGQPFVFEASVVNTFQPTLGRSGSDRSVDANSWQRRAHSAKEFGVLVVGTLKRLYFYDGKQWWYEWVSPHGIVDHTPTALSFAPSGELYVATNLSLSRVNINYTFDRIEGLPYNHLTSLHVATYIPLYPPLVGPALPPSKLGTLWIGSAKGYSLYDIQSSKFTGYFNGPRWLPGGSVLSMVGSGSHVVVLTEEGLAVVHPELWTLTSKAKHYQSMLKRHTREPGLVSDCLLTNHTPSTCSPSTTDGDGLWTSWALAAEAFRYQVTRNKAARENAWDLFNGMKLLLNVTGIEGLMAHSVVSENSSMDGEDWHDSPSVPGWRWKEGSGPNEVLGHMWVYPLVYDLVASNSEEKEQVEELVQEIVDYIQGNDYVFLDFHNQSTEAWGPAQLNLNQSWAGKRAVNSLQILSYLLSAYRITGDRDFLQGFKDLFSGLSQDSEEDYPVPTNYGWNMINQLTVPPKDTSLSTDYLSFLPYFLYHYSLERVEREQGEVVGVTARHCLELSIKKAWHSVANSKSSVWTVIFAYITGETHRDHLLTQLVWNLRTWPLELIDWPTTNSHRLDLHPQPHRTSGRCLQSSRVLPANERTQLSWTRNPFLLDWLGSSSEMDPGPWLLPYWMARWSGML